MTRPSSILTTILCAALLAGCANETAAIATTGTLTETGGLIAVLTDGEHVAAYACDGLNRAAWFRGEVVDGAFELETRGLVLSGVVAPDALTGVVAPDAITGSLTLLDGTVDEFTAATTTEEHTGIWRVDVTIDAEDYVAGWVVAPDGTQRGALVRRQTDSIVEAPTLNITDGTSNTLVGTLEVDHIVSPRDIMAEPM